MSDRFERIAGARAALCRPQSELIRMTGGDRVRFANGMLTCDVAALEPGRSCASLQLDRKGHVLALALLLVLDDALLLAADAGTGTALLDALEKHLIADDVEIERLVDWSELDFEGPGARQRLSELGVAAPDPGQVASAAWQGVDVIWSGGARLGAAGCRAFGPAAALEGLRATAGMPELSAEALEVLRIEALRPAWEVDVGDRNFPQEAGLEDWVSFEKGCYVGQEIVARIASRGAVKRRLVRLRADTPLAAGAEIRHAGKAVGRVTSAAAAPGCGCVALGYVKSEVAGAGTRVEVDGAAAVLD